MTAAGMGELHTWSERLLLAETLDEPCQRCRAKKIELEPLAYLDPFGKNGDVDERSLPQ